MIKTDCRFFKGYKPCVWNKKDGSECNSCEHYNKFKARILIIKLDSIGDVLRSTCIIEKIKEKSTDCHIVWITKKESIGLLSSNPEVDETWEFESIEMISRLKAGQWDVLYNLDNSNASAALATICSAKEKIGFVYSKTGNIEATNDAANTWLQMAVFDRLKKKNRRSYQEIMYHIGGFNPPISHPILAISEENISWSQLRINGLFKGVRNEGTLVGINTGSGARWPKKMISPEKIHTVIKMLLAQHPDVRILLLGGPNEIDLNETLEKAVGSKQVVNAGCDYSLIQFGSLVNACGAILCGDTLALHIASAVGTRCVALFGPTSFWEIFDYNGLIDKIRTDLDCLCCYGDCDKEQNCMSLIPAETIVDGLNNQLNRLSRNP